MIENILYQESPSGFRATAGIHLREILNTNQFEKKMHSFAPNELKITGRIPPWPINLQLAQETLLNGLTNEDELCFLYQVEPNHRLSWKILFSSNGGSKTQLREHVQEVLSSSLNFFDGPVSPFYFEEIEEIRDLQPESFEFPHKTTILPIGVELSSRETIGLKSNSGSPSRFSCAVPFLFFKECYPIDLINSGFLHASQPLTLRISISPKTISRSHREMIVQLQKIVHSSTIDFKTKRKKNVFTDLNDTDRQYLQFYLDTCLRKGHGYHFAVEIFSMEKLPSTKSCLLGEEFFPYSSVLEGKQHDFEIPEPLEKPRASEKWALDLRFFSPSAHSLPFFPSVACLEEAKVPTFYKFSHITGFKEGSLLGFVRQKKETRDIRLNRKGHTYIIGSTGWGKTNLLFNLIQEDIQRGAGVFLLDPHGDLAESVVAAIPREREKDLIYLNPYDKHGLIGFNCLNHNVPEVLMSLIQDRSDSTWVGPIFELYFRNGILAILNSTKLEHPTLFEFVRFFGNSTFRSEVVNSLRDEGLKAFWEGLADHVSSSDHQISSLAPYIVSKLNDFLFLDPFKNIVNQPQPKFKFRDVVENQKIFIASLPIGGKGELCSRYIGALLFRIFFQIGMERFAIEEQERQPFQFYIDEFQNFVDDSSARLITQGRKFGLRMTFANQSLAQLKSRFGQENVKSTVLGNMETIICFNVGPQDAEDIAPKIKPDFSMDTLIKMPKFQALCITSAGRQISPPFIFQTYLKTGIQSTDRTRKLKELSFKKYGLQKIEMPLPK